MSTDWLAQHVEELQREVKSLHLQLESIDQQLEGDREKLANADHSLTRAYSNSSRHNALTSLMRVRIDYTQTNERRLTTLAQLDHKQAVLNKALADLDQAEFTRRHNQDPQVKPEPIVAEITGEEIEQARVLVDEEIRQAPEQPASAVIQSWIRKQPKVAAAAGAAMALASSWLVVQPLATSTFAAGAGGASGSASLVAQGLQPSASQALRAALPMPAGAASATQLRPAVLVAAAALAKAPANARAEALSELVDELPVDLTEDEHNALLGPASGEDREAIQAILERLQ